MAKPRMLLFLIAPLLLTLALATGALAGGGGALPCFCPTPDYCFCETFLGSGLLGQVIQIRNGSESAVTGLQVDVSAITVGGLQAVIDSSASFPAGCGALPGTCLVPGFPDPGATAAFSLSGGGTLLDVSLSGFDPGEIYSFGFDVDVLGDDAAIVGTEDLGNLVLRVSLASGRTYTASLLGGGLDMSVEDFLVSHTLSENNGVTFESWTYWGDVIVARVPAPAALVLLAAGVLGIAGARHRRRR